jgi:hypothetical protein
MYRPNVGAGLLVVQTIKYLHFSDEKITKQKLLFWLI